MSGYSNFSKSNNAIDAELDGRFPASAAAKKLGVPAKFLADRCRWATGGEWHHTSGWYNSTAYFDTEILGQWMNGCTDECEESFTETLAAWQAEQKNKTTERTEDCTVTWIEWSGSRSHPKATNRRAEGCTVTDKGGAMVEVELPGGRIMRKGKKTNGFSVRTIEGKLLF